jgi:hypothetical protein
MDVRVGAYQPLVVTSFGRTRGAAASVAVTDSRLNGPVPEVKAISQQRASDILQAQRDLLAEGDRGTKVDIYA